MARYSYKKALQLLTEWAYKEGYTEISFDHTSVSYVSAKKMTLNTPSKIKIEGSYSTEYQVYLLLHELGHHQLRKDWDKFSAIFPVSAHAEEQHLENNDPKFKRRVMYDVSCMEEEFMAWNEGYNLGIELGIKINMDKWLELRAKCLMSYMRYYGKKKYY